MGDKTEKWTMVGPVKVVGSNQTLGVLHVNVLRHGDRLEGAVKSMDDLRCLA